MMTETLFWLNYPFKLLLLILMFNLLMFVSG